MRTASLADVCGIVMGQAPKGDTYNTDGVGLPLIAGAGDFGDLHPTVTKFTTADRVKTCRSGDIVLSIRASIGTKVLADGEYCLGRGVAGLRAGSGLDERYLWHWTTAAASTLAAKGRGATFLQVNKSDIAELEIPLPPIDEQRRIAGVLDAADALRAKRREALAKLDTLTQAIFVDMFGGGGWPIARLGDVVKTTSGGTPSRSRTDYFSGDIPWVKSGEVAQGVVSWTEERITDEAVARSSAKLMPPGTVLLAMYGATVGSVGVLGIEAATNQAICCLTPTNEFTGPYLLGLLRSMKRKLVGMGAGGAQPNISQTIIRDLRAPTPPIAEQHVYASRVDAVERQLAQSERSAATLDSLFSSLQQRAFRGEL